MRVKTLSYYKGCHYIDVDGREYRAQFALFPEDSGDYNPGVWETEIVPSLETIRGPDVSQFPAPEALEAIVRQFPTYASYRPARWNGDRVVCGPPELCRFCGKLEADCTGSGFDDGIAAHDFAPGGVR
jgi:hypothetical protein